MITGTIASLGLRAVSASPRWRMVAQRIADMLRRIPGMSLAPDFEITTERRIQHIEQRYKAAAAAACQKALGWLKEETPKDTGTTARLWDMVVADRGDEMTVTFVHPDPVRIRWLNYGTKPHAINPVNAKVLHFKINGKDIFAKYVFHPGTPAFGFEERVASRLNAELRALQTSFRGSV